MFLRGNEIYPVAKSVIDADNDQARVARSMVSANQR